MHGPLLKRMLEARQISQTAFARLMGVSEGYIRRLINEDRKPGAELEQQMVEFFATCWVCGSEWKDTPKGREHGH
jgi:transcriptional regulator with XRE-family HTH domain